MGGGAAHADDDRGTLFDDLSGLIGGTVETVTAPVSPVLTEIVSPVVSEVVTPVVSEVVTPVVTDVVAPVQHAAPVVAESVADAAAGVPVVDTIAVPVAESAPSAVHQVADSLVDALDEDPAS